MLAGTLCATSATRARVHLLQEARLGQHMATVPANPGACLFRPQQHHNSGNASMAASLYANSSAGSKSSTSLRETHRTQLQQQQHQEQTQYIVVLGDSQGMHYTEGMVRGLRAAGASCTLQKRESGVEYFGEPAGLAYRQQDCSGCFSSLTHCIHPTTQVTVDVEYLRMEFILDFEVTEKAHMHSSCKEDASALPPAGAPCKWAWTTQQLYFERYLALRPPSQLHVFQNIHDCARRNRADYARDHAWFISLRNSTLGQSASTEIYFWRATATNPDKQPGIWKNVTSADCVTFMNNVTEAAIYPLVVQTVRHMQAGTYSSRSSAAWHATFDMYEPTLERLDLNSDGVHFVHQWFDIVGSQMLLAGYCADKH
ncbi:hypothetical protein COO60DRAFT_1045481 [Scenedesmus sp. NREL 46B-D3]|nr:hypothetical protein COO60DRAFT_1045481 [Scenedesmus sp. NREL 46B-D3]